MHPKKDIVVAVVDSGVSSSIPQLNDKLLLGYNVLEDSSDVTDGPQKHGTVVAEIINMISKDSKIFPIKIESYDGSISYDNVAYGIDYAVSHGANIINLSIGSYSKIWRK